MTQETHPSVAPDVDALPTRVGVEGPPTTPSRGGDESQPVLEGRPCAQPGEVLADRYRILERLGRGGMGEVYLAAHVAIGRQVAVKILRADAQENPEMARRFIQEARTSSQLRHPNIVDITDFGHTERGAPFFVMELLEGEDLKALVKRERVLPWPRVVAIAAQVCAALAHAHAAGVVHRDMKPDNVYLLRQGGYEQVKVLDFGIAKVLSGQEAGEATRTGVLLGTPHYMSPEQASDDPLDGRSDIYAMGVLLYRMVAGQLPFRGASFMKVLGQQIHELPPPPREFAPAGTLSDEAEAIILKCLAKRREDRYQSAEELAAALLATLGLGDEVTSGALRAGTLGRPATLGGAALGGAARSGAAEPPAPEEALGAAPRRRSRVLWVSLPALLLAGGALAASMRSRDPVPAAVEPAPVAAPAPEAAPEPSLVAAEPEPPAAALDPPAAEPEPGPPAAAEPAPEPEPAPTPTKRDRGKKAAVKVEPKDSLGADDLGAAAASVRGALSQCMGGLPGMVVKVDVEVSAAGRVTSASAQKPQRGSALGRCVEDAARGARFPALRSAQSVTLALRFP